VVHEGIMDWIDASTTKRWYGYEKSWVIIGGAPVQSMTGGGHWGGGMVAVVRSIGGSGIDGLSGG